MAQTDGIEMIDCLDCISCGHETELDCETCDGTGEVPSEETPQ